MSLGSQQSPSVNLMVMKEHILDNLKQSFLSKPIFDLFLYKNFLWRSFCHFCSKSEVKVNNFGQQKPDIKKDTLPQKLKTPLKTF